METRSLRSTLAFRGTHTQLESFMAAFEGAFARANLAFPYDAFHFRAHTYQFRSTTLYTTGLAVIVNRNRLRVEGTTWEPPTPSPTTTWPGSGTASRAGSAPTCGSPGLGQSFHVFNTHLSLPTPFTREFWTDEGEDGLRAEPAHEAKKLAGFVQGHANGDPFVVGGDFNSPPALAGVPLPVGRGGIDRRPGVAEADRPVPRGFPTAGFFRLRMHLDHLFGGNGIRWVDIAGTEPFGRGPFHGLSDHVPLIARFEPPARQASSEAV